MGHRISNDTGLIRQTRRTNMGWRGRQRRPAASSLLSSGGRAALVAAHLGDHPLGDKVNDKTLRCRGCCGAYALKPRAESRSNPSATNGRPYGPIRVEKAVRGPRYQACRTKGNHADGRGRAWSRSTAFIAQIGPAVRQRIKAHPGSLREGPTIGPFPQQSCKQNTQPQRRAGDGTGQS